MNLSMNERAATLVDALVVDADALGIESTRWTRVRVWWIAAPRPVEGCRRAWGSRPRAWVAWAGSIRSA